MKAVVLLFLSVLVACGNAQTLPVNDEAPADKIPVSDTTFVNLRDFSTDFIYDMRYARTDNFLNAQVYECAECYLRYKTVKALLAASKKAVAKGYQIALFDCYRPTDIQKKMWKIVPNPIYVADPAKGSIHNRGGAVDITLVDATGKAIDMGTDFDHFGPEAAHSYIKLSEQQLNNRKTLSEIMTASGFTIFESEWWHYNLVGSAKDPISNFKWDCY
ncbi:MAG TPA: M15 family metallopeptidase [Flavobacterium sp.]|jgi:D-alanyl-D-alanine dipeptidase